MYFDILFNVQIKMRILFMKNTNCLMLSIINYIFYILYLYIFAQQGKDFIVSTVIAL